MGKYLSSDANAMQISDSRLTSPHLFFLKILSLVSLLGPMGERVVPITPQPQRFVLHFREVYFSVFPYDLAKNAFRTQVPGCGKEGEGK